MRHPWLNHHALQHPAAALWEKVEDMSEALERMNEQGEAE